MMFGQDPVQALELAMNSAISRDLPDVSYSVVDWEKSAAQGERVLQEIVRRPTEADIQIVMFPQIWGSTALGFGGIGGAAMTGAYTVVVSCRNHHVVYFGSQGKLAYLVSADNKVTHLIRFNEDLLRHKLCGCDDAIDAYGVARS